MTARGYLHCRKCEGEISVTAGTVFERTRSPMKTWLLAMWFVASQKQGVSTLGLQRVLGLGSYRTAWTWLHKLRRAMVRSGREPLRRRIEVDETYVGGTETGGKRGRGPDKKEIVVIAVEIKEPKGFGRVRMQRILDVSGASFAPFVSNVVEPGSEVHTDGWGGLQRIGQAWLQAQQDRPLQLRRSGPCGDARRTPNFIAAQALAPWHSPGGCKRQAPGLLLGRIHLPVQPPHLPIARDALLSPYGAGSCDGPGAAPGVDRRRPQHGGVTCFKGIPHFLYMWMISPQTRRAPRRLILLTGSIDRWLP